MAFAIPFTKSFEFLDEENIQLNIIYKPKIKELDNFIKQYGKHRINLIFSNSINNQDIKIIKALIEKHPNSNIIINFPTYIKEVEELLNTNNLQHYYNEFITDWDKFHGFLNLNVTDIVIGENLAFYAKKLKYFAEKNQKALRVFCNFSQSSWKNTPSLKTFFIRPEDIDLYSKYIDTFEFYFNNDFKYNLNTLYKIYTKDKKWFGKLSELIIGYDGQEDNRFLIPQFGQRRIDCGKRCFIDESCHFCDKVVELGQVLQKEQLLIKPIDKN